MGSKVAREAWAMIYRLVFEGEARDRMQSACTVAGAPPGVVKTLVHLEPGDGTQMGDLAAYFGVDASYVTSLVDELEAAGLAERRPHPKDRRIRTVALTDKGVAIQEQLRDVMWEAPASFDALTAAELRQLHDLLAKVLSADEHLAAPDPVTRGPFGRPPTPSGRHRR